MDIVNQCEIARVGQDLNYYDGMVEASRHFRLARLSRDYKKMRNDLLHQGVLSETNNRGKTKSQCAEIVADTLNWIDRYIGAVLGVRTSLGANPRWSGPRVSLPSFSNPT